MSKMRFKYILAIVLTILVCLVAIQNSSTIKLDFLLWRFYVSRILVILISFALGILAGLLLAYRSRRGGSQAGQNTSLR